MKPKIALESRPSRFRLRLTIAIPVLLILITGISGQTAKLIVAHAAITVGDVPAEEAFKAAIFDIEVMIIVSVILAGVVGYALSTVVTTPYRRISQRLETLAREGRAPSLDTSIGNEIGSLYASFNRMVTSLERFLPEQSRHLFHRVATGVLAINPEGVLTNINAAADKALELGGVGINGHHYKEFFRRFGDMREFIEVIRECLEDNVTHTGKEIRVSTISGTKKNLVVCTSLAPGRNDSDQGLVATVMDLELLQAVNAKMQHEDKLSSLGRLASGVAHEIRNPLASIRGMAQLLREGPVRENEDAARYTGIIMEEVDRLNGVVNRLLDFSRPSGDQRISASVTELLEKAVGLMRPRFKTNGTHVEFALEESLPKCRVVPDKIIQVFINLLINAVEAMGRGGKIRISAHQVTEGVQVAFHNSDSYIPPDVLAHLFEPFYTTKETGSGLGLALSYQIVHTHGGNLVAESNEGDGTTFLCTLPLEGPMLPESIEEDSPERDESLESHVA